MARDRLFPDVKVDRASAKEGRGQLNLLDREAEAAAFLALVRDLGATKEGLVRLYRETVVIAEDDVAYETLDRRDRSVLASAWSDLILVASEVVDAATKLRDGLTARGS